MLWEPQGLANSKQENRFDALSPTAHPPRRQADYPGPVRYRRSRYDQRSKEGKRRRDTQTQTSQMAGRSDAGLAIVKRHRPSSGRGKHSETTTL